MLRNVNFTLYSLSYVFSTGIIKEYIVIDEAWGLHTCGQISEGYRQLFSCTDGLMEPDILFVKSGATFSST